MIVIIIAIKYMKAETPPFSVRIDNRDLVVSAPVIRGERVCSCRFAMSSPGAQKSSQ